MLKICPGRVGEGRGGEGREAALTLLENNMHQKLTEQDKEAFPPLPPPLYKVFFL